MITILSDGLVESPVAMTDPTADNPNGEGEPAPEKYQLEGDDCPSEVEKLERYTQGGYHPVAIGDLLGDGGRFRVVHKLGFGGFATVWLCHDRATSKWRAVKIMAAEASTPECPDLRALELFGDADAAVLAANHIQLPLEHFWTAGPNGRHLCFVLPFLGPTLTEVFRVYGHLPGLTKDICFQLARALRFIHARGLCHGDFRTDNVLFRLAEGVDEWDEEALVSLLGTPSLFPVKPVPGQASELEPGVPAYLVSRANIGYGSGLCSPRIAVVDFGVSYRVSQPPIGKGTGIPAPFAAPEDVFEMDQSLGTHTDIWALGCSIVKVRLGFTPFCEEFDDLLKTVEKMEDIMGPMPHPFRTVWRSWNCPFVNCEDDEDSNPRDDDGGDNEDRAGGISWEDEKVPATLRTLEQSWIEKSRTEEVGAGNYLEYRMRRPRLMAIDDEEAADIAAQARANPHRLPSYKPPTPTAEDDAVIRYQRAVKYRMDEAEVRQLFDLLRKIFQWHPERRATLDEILEHEWFGRGSRAEEEEEAASTSSCSPPPPPSPKKSAGRSAQRRRRTRRKRGKRRGKRAAK